MLTAKIFVYCGPMKAAKTEKLIKLWKKTSFSQMCFSLGLAGEWYCFQMWSKWFFGSWSTHHQRNQNQISFQVYRVHRWNSISYPGTSGRHSLHWCPRNSLFWVELRWKRNHFSIYSNSLGCCQWRNVAWFKVWILSEQSQVVVSVEEIWFCLSTHSQATIFIWACNHLCIYLFMVWKKKLFLKRKFPLQKMEMYSILA